MVTKDRRSDLRGQIPFKIKYRILSREEYEQEKENSYLSLSMETYPPEILPDTAGEEKTKQLDPFLLEFLLQMDEKIDKILRMLEKEKGIDTSDSYGQGIDISASGMRVVIDSPAKQGDIIKSNFLLSKNPLIFVDVYGEIVWVKKKEAPNGTLHQMGVRFLDLQLGIKEKIISCIFQKQREDIRRMRSESAGAQ